MQQNGSTIVHVFPNGNYVVSDSYMDFIRENFKEEHLFTFICKKIDVPQYISERKDVFYIDNKQLIKLIKESQLVIFHSLFQFTSKFKLFLVLQPHYFDKIKWVAWGGDLYEWKYKDSSVKSLIKNMINYFFIKSFRSFVGIFPPDMDYFKRNFKTSARITYASYIGETKNSIYNEDLNLCTLQFKKKNNLCINIMIGHHSNTILNHIQVLLDMYGYRNQDIKIFIPLSYGDENYGDQVEKKASELYGNKVVCFRKMMDKEKYHEFLSKVDIAIFNTSRQIGLGNINPLLFLEKKIYLPSDSIMYNYYRELNINVCDYKRIANMSYEEFSEPVDMKSANQYIKDTELRIDKKIVMWSKVFNEPVRWRKLNE